MRTYINNLKAELNPTANPYLVSLQDGSLSREDFLETQIQFLFAVVFFSRPMAALAGRLPRPEMRVSLLENVHDEHGDGDLRFCHEKTFLRFLDLFGIDQAQIEARGLWPCVRAFNTALAGVCVMDDCFTALAALGIIEDLFSGISTTIGRAVIDRGWLKEDQIVHYAVHQELDVEHADGFYRELDAPYAAHPRHTYQIEQGLRFGGYIFMRLYEDLHRARDQRYLRAVRGPHSLADGWYLDAGV